MGAGTVAQWRRARLPQAIESSPSSFPDSMGKKQQNRSAARKASKASCLVKKAPAPKMAAKGKPAVGKGPKATYVPPKTQTVKLGTKRPGSVRSGPSAEKLALKQRRREEAEAAAAAKGRAEAAAFSAERASLWPEEVVIAPASFSVDAERESGDMQWLFDVDTARDAKKARLAKRTAAPKRTERLTCFMARAS